MPQQAGVNFIDQFLRGRAFAQELESAKNEEERRKQEFKMRQQEIADIIKRRQTQDVVNKLALEDYFRKQIISGERPEPSIPAGTPAIEGISEGMPEAEMTLPESFEVGGFQFRPQDIALTRKRMKEQLLSQGETAAQIAGMKESAITEAGLPKIGAQAEANILREMVRGGEARKTEESRQAGRLALSTKKAEDAEDLAALKSVYDYNKDIEVAKVRASIAINRQFGKQTDKLNAKQREALEDYGTLEELVAEARTLAEEDKYDFFSAPIIGGAIDVARSFGMTTPTKEALRVKLANIKSLVVHPRFGASFTKGEKELAESFTTSITGSETPERAKAKFNDMLDFIKKKKQGYSNIRQRSEEPVKKTNRIRVINDITYEETSPGKWVKK